MSAEQWADAESSLQRRTTNETEENTSPSVQSPTSASPIERLRPDGGIEKITYSRVSDTRTTADGTQVRYSKRIKTTHVTRPQNMTDIRKTWQKFGAALNNEPGLTVNENAIPFELGGSDPDERKARDEVIKLMNLALDAPIKLPAIRKSALASTAVAAQQQQQQATSSTAAAEPDLGGGRKTWAAGRQTRKEEEQAAKVAEGDKAKVNNVIRISNLTDEISELELRRLFGTENDLGEIKRVFIAKDKEGNRRGFAYITYGRESDAMKAVSKMHRKPFKHVILLVDYGTDRSGKR